MNSSNNNSFFNRFAKVESDDSQDSNFSNEVRPSTNQYDQRDTFGLVFASIPGLDFEMFCEVLGVFEFVSNLDLARQVNHAINNPVESWSVVNSFQNSSREFILDALNSATNANENNRFLAVGVELHNAGIQSVDMGFNDVIALDPYPKTLVSLLRDVSSLKASASIFKKGQIKNAVKCIIDVLPMRLKPDKNYASEFKMVSEMISLFDSGKFKYKLNKQVRLPKEPGLALPHTLTPRLWLNKAVSLLMKELFSPDSIVCFGFDGKIDVSKFDGTSYFLVSHDSKSPYHLRSHPGLKEWGEEVDGEWEWRHILATTRKSVGLELAERNVKGDSADRYLDGRLCEKLQDISDKYDFQESQLPCLLLHGQTPVFKFYKQGVSSIAELNQNTGYLHALSMNVISEVPRNYAKILLPDSATFVAIPQVLWNFTQLDEFFSRRGFQVEGEFADTKTLTLLYQLSHTFAYLEFLSGGPAYDLARHSKKLSNVMSTRNANDILFPVSARSVEEKSNFLNAMSTLVDGGAYGLVLTANRSKVGQRTATKVNSNSVYTRVNNGFQGELTPRGELVFDQFMPIEKKRGKKKPKSEKKKKSLTETISQAMDE